MYLNKIKNSLKIIIYVIIIKFNCCESLKLRCVSCSQRLRTALIFRRHFISNNFGSLCLIVAFVNQAFVMTSLNFSMPLQYSSKPTERSHEITASFTFINKWNFEDFLQQIFRLKKLPFLQKNNNNNEKSKKRKKERMFL